jgi:hypothetical protein
MRTRLRMSGAIPAFMAWRRTDLTFQPLFEEFNHSSHANCGDTEINIRKCSEFTPLGGQRPYPL